MRTRGGSHRTEHGDAELRLFESPTEELARLSVDEIIGGYYRQVGVVWDGGRTLARLTGEDHP